MRVIDIIEAQQFKVIMRVHLNWVASAVAGPLCLKTSTSLGIPIHQWLQCKCPCPLATEFKLGAGLTPMGLIAF